MLGLLTLLAAGLLALWLSLTLWTAWLLTHPPRRGYAWAISRSLPGDPGELRLAPRSPGEPAIERLPFNDTRIRVAPGIDLAAWDIPGADPAAPAVILSHGWGDSRVVMLSRLPAFWPLASRLILYDSRAHGDSTGRCALGVREADDLLRIIEYVRETGPVARIVLYGHSLGAGISIAAAARDLHIDAVIAEAPYRVPITPARNVLASRSYPHRATLPPALALVGLWAARAPSWAAQGTASGFDRVLHAARLPRTTRLLILHGSLDTICPLSDSRDIASAADAELIEIQGAAHTDLFTSPDCADQAAGIIKTFMAALPPHNLPGTLSRATL